MKIKILIYHYTNAEGIKTVKLSFFGNNTFTTASGKASSVKRSYWYVKPDFIEPCLSASRFCYIAEVNQEALYNIIIDKLKLSKKYTFDVILRKVKALGYKGIYGNVNGQYDIVCLFYNQKVKNIEVLK